jgi:hypothetical protein
LAFEVKPEGITCVPCNGGSLVRGVDFEDSAVKNDFKTKSLPVARQDWIEVQLLVSHAHASETFDYAHPGTGH